MASETKTHSQNSGRSDSEESSDSKRPTTCQNCKNSFVIEPEDFKFYEKIKVPPPTWCPECRMVRQMNFRNERSLYNRKCDAVGHSEVLVSMFPPQSRVKVYDYKFWWSDSWDALEYGRDYDFSRPFFEQFDDLMESVPHPNLVNKNTINSDYCNSVLDLKNCYLVFAASVVENTFYSSWLDFVKDSMDNFWTVKCELCYESLLCDESYNIKFCGFCLQCIDSSFLWDCRGCSNCFGCIGLRNKSYHIFNKPYPKEEYFKKINEYDVGSYISLKRLFEEFKRFRLDYPYRFARITRSINSTGDNIQNSKNAFNCFDIRGDGAEDCRYVSVIVGKDIKDAHSTFIIVTNGSLIYDSASIINASSILFSKKIWTGHNIQYSYNCHGCNNLFACIGLRSKSYCILNKQYTKEEYLKLVARIMKHMDEMPYVDKKGRIYKYGEFFPPELSPFAYNETIAQEYFPLTKEEAIEKGYSWKDPEPRNYKIQISNDKLPDHIKDVKDDIVGQVIECQHQGKCNEQCTEAYKIIPQELAFLRKMNLPLPRLCPNCRHYQRIRQRNPLKLWHRRCECEGQKSKTKNQNQYTNTADHIHHKKDEHCPNEFETTYAPERPEIVYCEQCYLREVV